jgi:hypothetical protein
MSRRPSSLLTAQPLPPLLAMALVAAGGVVLGGVYAFRKQHFSEVQLHTDRYASAAEQLGHADARTRLAGI